MKYSSGPKGTVEEKTDVIFGNRKKICSNVVVSLLCEFALRNSEIAVHLCEKEEVIIDAM